MAINARLRDAVLRAVQLKLAEEDAAHAKQWKPYTAPQRVRRKSPRSGQDRAIFGTPRCPVLRPVPLRHVRGLHRRLSDDASSFGTNPKTKANPPLCRLAARAGKRPVSVTYPNPPRRTKFVTPWPSHRAIDLHQG